MKELCLYCKKPADVSCSCDISLRFCYKDYSLNHESKGNHTCIDLAKRTQEINERLKSSLENLNKAKARIISKSNQLSHIVQLLTKNLLSVINQSIEDCESSLKTIDLSVDLKTFFKEYEKIQFQEVDIRPFAEIASQNLLLTNNDEISLQNQEFESFLNEISPNPSRLSKDDLKTSQEYKPIKLSKDVEELKKQLETEFSLYLEGHTSSIESLAVSNDNKFIISGSDDSTIRV